MEGVDCGAVGGSALVRRVGRFAIGDVPDGLGFTCAWTLPRLDDVPGVLGVVMLLVSIAAGAVVSTTAPATMTRSYRPSCF